MARTTHFTEQHLTKLTKHQADQDADEAAVAADDRSQKPPLAQRRFFDSNDNLATANGCTAAVAGTPRPDKPPRPVLVSTECQTLNRSQYRSAKETDRANKPAVQPKSMLFVNRSTENLSDKRGDDDEHFYDEVAVTFREKADSDGGGGGGNGEKPAKPAIPERPISLMRPPSYKTQANDTTNYQPSSLQQLHTQHDQQPLKKTQSFRSNATTTTAQTPTKMNGAGNGSLTTLERTHIYNVDKKQVAIIDFVDQISAAASSSNREKRPTLDDSTTDTAATMTTTTTMSTVPPSPRGFDSKIKRPGVPAPPPPTNRPKSDGGDSTNL